MRGKKVTDENINLVFNLKKQGMTHKAISIATGLSLEKVRYISRCKAKAKQSPVPEQPTTFIREEWKKPLHECTPDVIGRYLTHLGCTGTIEIHITRQIKI